MHWGGGALDAFEGGGMGSDSQSEGVPLVAGSRLE